MIAIQDILYVRYQVPDLDLMEKFLLDFGLFRTARTEKTLYMRSRSDVPYVHVSDLGPERSMSFGLLAKSLDDLHALAEECNTKVVPNPDPAGGFIVSLTDPSGFDVTVHAAINKVEPINSRESSGTNFSVNRNRLGTIHRVPNGPSQVQRLGHVALRCKDLEGSLEFFTTKLGMRISDSGYAGAEDNVVVYFLHCGLGKEFTDHHTIALFKRPESKIDHSAFEVLDIDDLMVGNNYLLERGYNHSWGIGRHVEGSQVFDYWRDPFGNKIEHWTDGDLVNEDYVGKLSKLTPDGLAQWGPPVPADFYK